MKQLKNAQVVVNPTTIRSRPQRSLLLETQQICKYPVNAPWIICTHLFLIVQLPNPFVMMLTFCCLLAPQAFQIFQSFSVWMHLIKVYSRNASYGLNWISTPNESLFQKCVIYTALDIYISITARLCLKIDVKPQ